MIAFLRGAVLEKHPNLALLDVGGVGYALTIPVSTFSQLPEQGEQASLFAFTYVREDTLALYGFHTQREKQLFEKLIAVSGVGPRLAVTLLSGMPVEELLLAIRSGDGKKLTKIPGVGRKTGERIILELREKLGAIEAAAESASAGPAQQLDEDVVSAIMNLGSSADAAHQAVEQARGEGLPAEFEPLFRRALEIVRR